METGWYESKVTVDGAKVRARRTFELQHFVSITTRHEQVAVGAEGKTVRVGEPTSTGRDAIAITETTSGGQTRKTGGKWRQDDYYQPLLETMSQVQKAFTKKEKGGDGLLSGSLAYDMRDIEIVLGGDDMKDARKEDFHRLLKRRTLDTSQASRVQELGEHLIQLAEEPTMGWGGLSNWLILEIVVDLGIYVVMGAVAGFLVGRGITENKELT